MSDLVALEYQSSCLSVYGNSGQSPDSTLQSLTSKSCSTVEANVSDAATIAPAQLNGSSTPPIPQRRPRPTTIYQNLPISENFEPKPDNLDNDVLSQHHRSRRNSCPGVANQRKTVVSKSMPKPLSRAKVYRWDGQKRTVSDWDGLRRDPELWFEDGDCYVHLHGNGISRRGPSFLIPLQVFQEKKCKIVWFEGEAQTDMIPGSRPQKLICMPSAINNTVHKPGSVHIFFPPPEDASREDSFKWHISTRNFFAYLLDKPLVGETMGQAFVDLQERLELLRPEVSRNQKDFLNYADKMGYRDFFDCTDLALANLFYAEHYKLKDVWIDAFAHCVGMHESLVLSPEFSLISDLTKALIARAHHEIDIQLCKVTVALGNFLDEDLSPMHLGLTPQTRSHLDRFRKLLHDFYSAKFGYWPPRFGSFPKLLYKSMQKDFRALYDYLVDTESTTDLSHQKPASGGICVLQNVVNFDKRHNFDAQPHPLPLLPSCTPSGKPESQTVLKQWKQPSHNQKTHQFHTMNAMLAVSTNTLAKDMRNSQIIQAYMQFESATSMNPSPDEDKLSARDARKVRWLLIYGTLQYLEYALRAPKEVRDIESPDYPLCCLNVGQVSWNDDFKLATGSPDSEATTPQEPEEGRSSPSFGLDAVQPDCQRDDYFAPKPTLHDESSEGSLPLKLSQTSRSKSVRALSRLSLSARNSRRFSLNVKSKQHSPIVLPVYGDGLKELTITPSAQDYSDEESTEQSDDLAQFHIRCNEPLLEEDMLSKSTTPLPNMVSDDQSIGLAISDAPNSPPARSDSTGSTTSSVWSQGASAASSKSSADGDHDVPTKTDVAEDGGLLGGFVPISQIPVERSQSRKYSLLRRVSKPESLHRDFKAAGEEAACPSPPLPLLPDCHQVTSTSNITTALPAEDLKPFVPLRSAARSTNPVNTAPQPKRKRSTDILSALITPTTRAWDQYKTTRSRPATACTESPVTPSTKPSFSFKIPSLRFPAKLDRSESQFEKREKRFSVLWRK